MSSNKPWLIEENGRQLEAFIGAFGIHTSQFSSADELIWFGCKLFDIDPVGINSTKEAALKIEAIGKKERSRRAHNNREYLFPNENFSRKKSNRSSDSEITESSLQRMMSKSHPQMIDGDPFDCAGELDIDPAQLLRKVVSAVISAGRADILWEFPDVLAFFGSRIPQRDEVAHLHNVDQRMFEAADKWPNRIHRDA